MGDYTHFRVEIVDNNDTDADGLPDLVAVPEPNRSAMLIAGAAFLGVLHRQRIRASRVH